MNFGIPIDNDFLRTLPEYKGKPDSELTAEDRSNVALQRKNEYVGEAVRYVKGLKEDYGHGVCTLCRFYNASGDPIRVDIAHSWTGRFYRGEPPAIVENGQWTAFLHVHPTGTKKGSVGAVIYRTIEDTDIFFGWQNPWRAMHGTRYTEKDYWWGSESNILPLAEDKGCRKDQSIQRGYKSVVELSGGTTSRCIGTIEKA